MIKTEKNIFNAIYTYLMGCRVLLLTNCLAGSTSHNFIRIIDHIWYDLIDKTLKMHMVSHHDELAKLSQLCASTSQDTKW